MSDIELAEEKVQMDLDDHGYAFAGEAMETDQLGTEHEFIHVPSVNIKCEVDPDDVVVEEPAEPQLQEPLNFAPDDPLNCHFMLAPEQPCSSQQVLSEPSSNDQQSSKAMQEIQVCIRRASGAVTTTPMRIPKDGDIMTHLMSRIKTHSNPQLANKVKIVVNNVGTGSKETFYYKSPRDKTTYCEVEGCSWRTNDSDPDRVLASLKLHLAKSHRDMSVCQYCTNVFESRHDLTQHINKFHVTYVCSHCNTRFEANRELCFHQLKCRNIPQNNLPESERKTYAARKNTEAPQRNTINLLRTNQPQKFACGVTEQKEKQRRKPLNKTYSCKIADCCWYTCITDRKLALLALRDHMSDEHASVSMCVCLVLYPSRQSLMGHIKTCKKQFSCDHCSETFSKTQELYVHYVKVHSYYSKDEETTNTPPKTCSNIECTWTNNSSQKIESLIQMKLHSICEHGTINICDICLTMFNNNQQLLLHFAKNHDKFLCVDCPRLEFDTHKKLAIHTRKHHSKTLISPTGEKIDDSSEDSDPDDVEILDSMSKTSRIEADVVSIASGSENEDGDSAWSSGPRNESVASTLPSSRNETTSELPSNIRNEDSKLLGNSTLGEVVETHNEMDTSDSPQLKTVKSKVPSLLIHCQVELCQYTTDGTDEKRAMFNMKNHTALFHRGLHICDSCFSLFKSKQELTTHSLQAHDTYNCQYCQSKFSKEDELEIHQVQYHGNAIVSSKNEVTTEIPQRKIVKRKLPSSFVQCQAEFCEYATDGTNKKRALYNMKNHTAVFHSRLHLCVTCLSLFKTKKELMLHSVQAHITHNCQYCRSKFSNEDELEIHRVQYHEKPAVGSRVTTRAKAAEISINGILKTAANKQPVNPLTWCSWPDCMWSTDAVEPDEILMNVQCHASFVHNKNHVCEHCFSLFDYLGDRLDHINEEHLKQCSICSFKYVTNKELDEHLVNAHLVPSNVPLKRGPVMGAEERNENRLESGRFLCKICFLSLNDHDQYTTHCVECHTVPSDLNVDQIKNKDCLVYHKHYCKKCFVRTNNLSKLRLHLITHGLPISVPAVLKGGVKECYECPIKGRSCTLQKWIPSKEAIENHFRTYHGLSDEEFPPYKKNYLDPSEWYTTKIFEQKVEYKYKSRYECQYCADLFPTLNDIQTHFKAKHGKYRCTKCLSMFDSQEEILAHDQEVHVAKCTLCDFTAIRHQSMMLHMTKSHGDVDPSLWNIHSTSTSNLACKLCTQTFTSTLNAKMHYYFYHSKYACEFCWLSFNQSAQEDSHFKQNHLTECRHCTTLFECQEDLMFHVEEKHPDDRGPLCESCGEYTIDRETLLEHRADHGKPLTVVKKPWQVTLLCNLCGAMAASQVALERHMIAKHTEDDQRSGNFCKICNKQYKSIQMHMYRTHGAAAVKSMNKVMKFKCPHCPKRFSGYFDLKRHLPRHSKYTCNLCPMQFNYLPNLDEHVKELHSNPFAYSCGVCHKVFATNSDFQVHMGFHSPNSQDVSPKLLPYWRCQLCEQFCLSHDAIKKHIETDHIRGRKLVNVKRRKPTGRVPYLKRV